MTPTDATAPGPAVRPPTDPRPEEVLAHLSRTTEQIFGREDLLERLAEDRPLRIKFGVDLTAPSLHLGHAVNLWMMRHLQDLGHTVVFLLGDVTTRIGDPTGRSTTRPVLTQQEIQDNADAFLAQVTRVLRPDPAALEVRRNSEWLDGLGVGDLLQELSHLTHSRLISRDMFRARIAVGSDIAMHELLYPVLQALDSVHLHSDLTIVGSDQLFNETLGRDLQARHGQRPQTVITSVVTPGLDGGPKQSKSLGNFVGLCDPAAEKFGRLMTLRDDLIEQWARVYSDLPLDQVARLGEDGRAGGVRARDAKLDLAQAVVARHDGDTAARASREEFLRVFSARQRPEVMEDLPQPSSPMSALDLVTRARPELSRSEARRLLTGGGVTLEERPLEDPAQMLTVLPGEVLRAGRRRWFRVGG